MKVYSVKRSRSPAGWGGGSVTPLYDLYGYVPLDRVWFSASLSLSLS